MTRDRLYQIIKGLQAAGGGSFQITLIEEGPDKGQWAVSAVFGREPGSASCGMTDNPADAVRTILDETKWGDI